jgi:hypothetical protein
MRILFFFALMTFNSLAVTGNRGFALSGAGISHSTQFSANYHNPANLIPPPYSNTNTSIFIKAGASVEGSDDSYQAYLDTYDAYEAFNSAPSPTTQATLASALEDIKSKKVIINFGTLVGLSTYIAPGGIGYYYARNYHTFMANHIDQIDLDPATDIQTDGLSSYLGSSIAEVVEHGLMMAMPAKFFSKGFSKKLYFGMTLKKQIITTYHLPSLTANQPLETGLDIAKGQKTYPDAIQLQEDYNLDLGLMYREGNGFQYALLVKDAFSNTVPLQPKNSSAGFFVMRPSFIAGISYQRPRFAAYVDVDLNERTYFEGISYKDHLIETVDNEQLVTTGAEYGVSHFLSILLGAQFNLASNNIGDYNLKAGFNIHFEHISIVVEGSGRSLHTLGAQSSLGFKF